ncbi:conserved hypothetical protein [Methylocella tundrae]|jgi:hypothetical protein|uniref:Uncharacterized protein n=1 Tax=Methylocella tundrae TaxID=227605 RepID=A0A4U8Z5I9_METTU|nr:hypothetical protein [Methylocella tundrae]WPP04429.1 hypothetical protein SIN04_18645 [Methylocella tundrae]VFU10798.1 conserved protein of unknown function [Methylocella tundrae]VTZ25002.1 conserved hypothetical protein [Methylocella tundrae]VTZ50780.1 conserved hypothetical protein [Methylocella tundrae]
MSSGRTLREKIVAKLTELQHLYEAGQISHDSDQYLDLVALRELQRIMAQLKYWTFFADGENSPEMALTSQTLH